jgi:hypothetical protein
MGDLDITKKREPKESSSKFPPVFHKQKSKLKKFAMNVCIFPTF